LKKIFFVLLVLFHQIGLSQSFKKDLAIGSWYCSTKLNDSLPILLSKLKPANFQFELQFTKASTIIRYDERGNLIDSVLKYTSKENLLSINYHSVDSTQYFWYQLNSGNSNAEIYLKLKNQMKNVRTRADTASYDFLWLHNNRKTRDVVRFDHLIIRSKNPSNTNEIVKIKGGFLQIKGDSIYLDSLNIAKYNSSSLTSDTIKTPMKTVAYKNITSIKHVRKKLNYAMSWGIATSILTALVISPIVSYEKDNFNSDRASLISSISMATLPLFITMRYVFSHKKMKINSGKDSWELW
jgi:hypothetical protein